MLLFAAAPNFRGKGKLLCRAARRASHLAVGVELEFMVRSPLVTVVRVCPLTFSESTASYPSGLDEHSRRARRSEWRLRPS